MDKDYPSFERDAADEAAASAYGSDVPSEAPASEPAPDSRIHANADAPAQIGDQAGNQTGDQTIDQVNQDSDIAAGPSEGPFAEGLWWKLRWWVMQLMIVFVHPEDLQGRQLKRREVRLLANWLRGVEGLARRLLIAAAATFDVGVLPKPRARKDVARTADRKPPASDGKRLCSFRALDWRDVCYQPAPFAPPAPFAAFASRAPRSAPKTPPRPPKSRFHPDYNPHYRDEFDPPPPPRLSKPRPGPRPKKVDNNPWKIFPPEPEVDDGRRWPGLPYARRIEALRSLVLEPERFVRRVALRIARRRDGWAQLTLMRDPRRGKIEPPAWNDWYDAFLDAHEACSLRWRQAEPLAEPLPDTS
jgi:hypothetical protein